MKALHLPMSLLLLLFATACVTINVYFPAEAAVKAADRIILDVYGNVPGGQEDAGEQQQPSEPTSGPVPAALPQRAVSSILDWLITPAQAAADLSINTPAIRQLTASMEARIRQLAPHCMRKWRAPMVILSGKGKFAPPSRAAGWIMHAPAGGTWTRAATGSRNSTDR